MPSINTLTKDSPVAGTTEGNVYVLLKVKGFFEDILDVFRTWDGNVYATVYTTVEFEQDQACGYLSFVPLAEIKAEAMEFLETELAKFANLETVMDSVNPLCSVLNYGLASAYRRRAWLKSTWASASLTFPKERHQRRTYITYWRAGNKELFDFTDHALRNKECRTYLMSIYPFNFESINTTIFDDLTKEFLFAVYYRI